MNNIVHSVLFYRLGHCFHIFRFRVPDGIKGQGEDKASATLHFLSDIFHFPFPADGPEKEIAPVGQLAIQLPQV